MRTQIETEPKSNVKNFDKFHRNDNPKYDILIDDQIQFEFEGIFRKLNRIRHSKTGRYGGYIESEINLSQYGSCWVVYESRVFGDAIVMDSAQILEGSTVCGDALIWEEGWVSSGRIVQGCTQISSRDGIPDPE